MTELHQLENSHRQKKNRKRVGRGIGSGVGKTCGRGYKGQGARSGYKRRYGKEGGQMPLFMKLPIRGFSNVRFRKELAVINLNQIEDIYKDGEVVNINTLKQKGFISGTIYGLKILGQGNLTKKVTLEVHSISKTAEEKLKKSKIQCTIIENPKKAE